MVVGDFNCPKCGQLMEHGTIRLYGGRGGAGVKFKREELPWKEDKEPARADWERLIHTKILRNALDMEARRCTKCSLILFGY